MFWTDGQFDTDRSWAACKRAWGLLGGWRTSTIGILGGTEFQEKLVLGVGAPLPDRSPHPHALFTSSSRPWWSNTAAAGHRLDLVRDGPRLHRPRQLRNVRELRVLRDLVAHSCSLRSPACDRPHALADLPQLELRRAYRSRGGRQPRRRSTSRSRCEIGVSPRSTASRSTVLARPTARACSRMTSSSKRAHRALQAKRPTESRVHLQTARSSRMAAATSSVCRAQGLRRSRQDDAPHPAIARCTRASAGGTSTTRVTHAATSRAVVTIDFF